MFGKYTPYVVRWIGIDCLDNWLWDGVLGRSGVAQKKETDNALGLTILSHGKILSTTLECWCWEADGFHEIKTVKKWQEKEQCKESM